MGGRAGGGGCSLSEECLLNPVALIAGRYASEENRLEWRQDTSISFLLVVFVSWACVYVCVRGRGVAPFFLLGRVPNRAALSRAFSAPRDVISALRRSPPVRDLRVARASSGPVAFPEADGQ